MDMENGHINTKCTKQLQYMVQQALTSAVRYER